MTSLIVSILHVINIFFLIYLLVYASYLFFFVLFCALNLYKTHQMRQIKNELKHQFYFPVSILVPAYNEEVTIVDSVCSLLNLDYRLYEIIVVDDGSTDNTTKALCEHFNMRKTNRPIHKKIACQPEEAIYEAVDTKVKLTLIRKKNGGKGDALNMGINASEFPYFICMDADSMLQKDSLERIVQPVMEDDNIVAVGGMIRVAQCVELEDGEVMSYHLPWNLLTAMQVMEYDRSFLASRILLDQFNSNLIISGAFGLFKKDVAIAAGGYDHDTLGEDMELVIKMHVFCRNNMEKYAIRYEPGAICWSQVPSSLLDMKKQRRRWHLGLFQCLMKYRYIFFRPRYGVMGSLSYLYYLLYELFSPQIELIGLAVTILSGFCGLLNWDFMIRFYLLYTMYSAILTITAFFQRIYTQNLKISTMDIVKSCIICMIENVFFRFFLDFVRATSFVGYRKRKKQWGNITRTKINRE